MGTTFGTNMKITVLTGQRAAVTKLFRDVLGARLATPRPDLDVFTFADGFNLGASFVEDGSVLDARHHVRAPWLELVVDDPQATKRGLAELGIVPFEYTDVDHDYYCPPFGPVFRLRKRSP